MGNATIWRILIDYARCSAVCAQPQSCIEPAYCAPSAHAIVILRAHRGLKADCGGLKSAKEERDGAQVLTISQPSCKYANRSTDFCIRFCRDREDVERCNDGVPVRAVLQNKRRPTLLSRWLDVPHESHPRWFFTNLRHTAYMD